MIMARYADEIKLHLEQAVTNLQTANGLLEEGQYGPAVASAAESVFHSSTALLFDEGIESGGHGDVLTLIQQIFVNGRRLTREQGEKLIWVFQLGNAQKTATGSPPPLILGEAQKAIEFAENFFEAARVIIEA
jgi:uncharacterized protein (UPF0332 family)